MALVLIPREGNQKYMSFLYLPFCLLQEGGLFGFFSEVENSWIMCDVGRLDCAGALGSLQQRPGMELEL